MPWSSNTDYEPENSCWSRFYLSKVCWLPSQLSLVVFLLFFGTIAGLLMRAESSRPCTGF